MMQQVEDFKTTLSRLGLMDEEGHMSKDCLSIVHRSFVRQNIAIENIRKGESKDV